MPTVLDSLRDKRGIRILDTQLDDITGQVGRFDLLYHTNGRVYIIFARTNQGNDPVVTGEKVDRQIWAAYSTDGGTNFEHLTQLTDRNGNWHDHPSMCQIEPDKTTSDIAVVFGSALDWMNWSNSGANDFYPYRFTMDIELVKNSPIDVLTNYADEARMSCLLRGSNRFLWFCATAGADGIYIYENQIIETNAGDGFLDNAWQRRQLSNLGGVNDVMAFRVHRLKNGHIVLLFAGRTTNNAAITQANLYYKISSDDGYTWTAPVALTSYSTPSPIVDLAGFQGVMDADFAELSDGSLALIYQEGKGAQYLDSGSNPAFNYWSTQTPTLLEGRNHLIIPHRDASTGGVWVFDLTTGTMLFRLTTTTTPPLWSTYCSCLAVSPDENYMAVGTDLSIDFFDIHDPDPTKWTIIQSLRYTTTPALLKSAVNWVKFIDNTHCIFSYGADTAHAGIANTWGGKVDVTNLAAGIVPMMSSSERDTRTFAYGDPQPYVDTSRDIIYCTSNSHLWATRLSDGVALRGVAIGDNCEEVLYDDVNDEYILTNTYGIYRYIDTGTTFTRVGTLLTTATPTMFPANPYTALCYPGSGIMFQLYKTPAWYDFQSQTCCGPLLNMLERYFGFNHINGFAARVPKLARNGEWAMCANERGQTFLPMKHIGRLRWGIFSYDAATKTIDAGSSDFYDLVDTAWVPADDTTHLVTPRVCAAPSDNLVLAAFRYFPGRQGARGLAFVTGVMNLEHRQLGMRAAITKRQTADGLALKGRMAARTTGTLGIKVQIHMAKCVKMRAWIIPEQTQAVEIRASIVGIKTRKWAGQFTVSHSGKTRRYRLQFTANTGYTGKQGFGMKTRIVAVTKKKFTGHFIVPANPTDEGIFAFSASLGHKHTMAMKAFLVSSR